MKIQYSSASLVIFESALFRTTTTLIIGTDYLLLIDPNWLPIEICFIQDYIDKLDGDREKYLLFTHSDYDHIIGYGQFSKFQTIASTQFVNNPKIESILEQIQTFDDENYITRPYTIVYPAIDIKIDVEQKLIKLGEDDYLIQYAEGHNRDGIITYNINKGILVVGDYLSNIEFPYVYYSFADYRNTLNKIEHIMNTHDVNILITGHGDHTTDLNEIKIRIEESRNYIDELEYSIKSNRPFDLENLFKRYRYPTIMTKFHESNIEFLKTEMAINKV